MGYRSEVIFGVRKDSRDKMDKVLEEHDLQDSHKWYEKTYSWSEFNKENNKITYTEYWIMWVGDYLKWYDEFEDVKAVNKCIDDLGDKAFMVALGEDGVIHSEIGYWSEYVGHVCKLELY